MGKIVIKRNGVNHLSLVERNKRTINSATQNKVILSDDSVTIRVQSNSVLDIKINDTFEVYGDVYRINQMPSVTKNNETSYEYDIVGQGLMFDLLRCKFFNSDGTGFKTTREFPLVGTIEVFLLALKANMQRLSVNWEIGNFTNGETKTITFSDDTCLSALQKICQEFKTEFWVKAEGGKFKIHTGNFGSTLPQTLQYGKGKGLYNLSRKNVNENGIINRLYVDGGTQNIPANYRGFSDRLKFSNAGYLEDAALIAEHGLKEGSIVFDDIYPRRTGKVTDVEDEYTFYDDTMDFDLNEKEADGITTKYLVAGQTAKIHFNTGNLAGYEFEVSQYGSSSKSFTIIPFKNEQNYEIPSIDSAAFQFAVGDEYVLLDIVMPQTYITNAETQLQTKGNEQFALLKQAKVSYDLNVAEDFLKTLATPLQIGDMVRVVDTALGIDKTLRVNQITRNFIQNGEVNDYDYKVVIADSYEVAFASKLLLDIQDIRNVVNVQKIDQLRLSKIGLRITEELKESIFDPDGKLDTSIIRENSIQANMFASGARSQAISTNLILKTNVGNNANSVSGDAFRIYSQSLEKEWILSAFSQVVPDNNLRYVYAKVSKTGTTGTIHITTAKITFDSDPNDYYILLGMLSSVIEGVRVFVPTYGMTTITGGLIRTGIISSNDGQTQFNLNTGEITGKITFLAGSTGYNNLADKPDLSSLEEARDYVNNLLQTELEDLKNRADGVIESWFYSHTPTLNNLPASNWTTDAEKDKHIGDTFTNNQAFVDNATTPDAGKAWRFAKNPDGSYSWNLIANSDSTKALIEAGKAKDTADAKRRVFVALPFPPYDIGDLWAQGAGGELMRCVVTRISGVYVASDWVKATKYTDDTAVNNLQIGGRNLMLDSSGVRNYAFPVTTAEPLKQGEQYTLSFEVLGNANGNVFLNNSISSTFDPSGTGWRRKHITFTFVKNDYLGKELYPHIYGADSVRKIKLEKGNKATDHTLAQEDVEQMIQDQQIYIEYSADATNWHLGFQTGDLFMHQKKGSGAWSNAIRIVGEKGAAGSEGRYTDFQFAKNTSTTTPPTTGWQDEPPIISEGEFVWMRSGDVIPPATEPTTWTPATRITGVKGEKGDQGLQGLQGPQGTQGIPGPKGDAGQTYYTWIKYADTPTSGMSDSGTGKAYIGFAYNKTTATESTNYSDYTWSLIKGDKGDTGVAGAKGADGQTLYTWIKYSDNPDGTGLYDIPTANTLYIGIAVNKTTATESTVKTDYVWSRFKGDQGLQGLQGVPGAKGADGQTTYFHIKYAPVQNPTAAQMSETPDVFIGTYVDFIPTDSGDPTKYTWSRFQGLKGDQGIKGEDGENGTTYYLHIAYADTATGGGFSQDPTGKSYIGTYTDTIEQDSSSPSAYTWAKFRGEPITSSTPPPNPYSGMVWIDTSLNPPQQKIWDGTKWVVVNDVQIGGRNLIKNSALFSDGRDNVVVNNEHSGAFGGDYVVMKNTAQGGSLYAGVNNLVVGQEYTFSVELINYGSLMLKNYFGASKTYSGIMGWKRVSLTFTASQSQDILFVSNLNAVGDGMPVRNWKLEKGNKATDWSPAPEDVDSAIAAAQTAANAANTKLSEIASDSILSASEKQQTKKEWDIIVSEKTTVESQASAVGVSAGAYTGAYTALNIYITPLLSDLNTNSAIDGNIFRVKFKDYYDAKIALLKAVTDKLNTKVGDVEAAQNAQIQRVVDLEGKTDFLTQSQTNGNAMATGTLIVGNGQGANAGITGLGDANSVRFWAGSNTAGRETANWLMRENGIEEQWILYNGVRKLLRRRGFINGNYYDDLYNPANDTLAKRTAVINGFITEQWYNNGSLVYEVGKNGIYYVAEIPESYTVALMKQVSSLSEAPGELVFDFCKNGIYINQKTQWTSYSSYLYSAGQNAYSESNKVYEGYKTTNGNKYNSIPDGYYVLNGANWTHDSTNVYVPVATITGGKITNQTQVTIPKSNIPICS